MPRFTFSLPRLAARRGAAAAALSALLAAGCGGGTSQQDPFIPDRIITFGDESGLLIESADDTLKARRYGINGLSSSTATPPSTFDCTLLPTWTQTLVGYYGLHFEVCPGSATTEAKAFQRAVAGTGANALAAQVQAQVDAGGFTAKDLAVVMTGTNDIIEVYEKIGTAEVPDVAAASTELLQRGATVAAQVNAMIALGAKVVVATVPRIDQTPYGVAKEAAATGQAAILKTLSDAFHRNLRLDIPSDGSKVGLVLADDLVAAMVKAPGSYGFSSTTVGACTTAPPACTNATLLAATDTTAAASTASHLWADDRHLGPTAQRLLGAQFITRAAENPF